MEGLSQAVWKRVMHVGGVVLGCHQVTSVEYSQVRQKITVRVTWLVSFPKSQMMYTVYWVTQDVL